MIYVSTESVDYILRNRPDVIEHHDGRDYVPALVFSGVEIDYEPEESPWLYSNVALGGVYIYVHNEDRVISDLGNDYVEPSSAEAYGPWSSCFATQILEQI